MSEEAGHWTSSEMCTFGERWVCVFTHGSGQDAVLVEETEQEELRPAGQQTLGY